MKVAWGEGFRNYDKGAGRRRTSIVEIEKVDQVFHPFPATGFCLK